MQKLLRVAKTVVSFSGRAASATVSSIVLVALVGDTEWGFDPKPATTPQIAQGGQLAIQ